MTPHVKFRTHKIKKNHLIRSSLILASDTQIFHKQRQNPVLNDLKKKKKDSVTLFSKCGLNKKKILNNSKKGCLLR